MRRSFFKLAVTGGLWTFLLPWSVSGQESKDSPSAYTALRLVGKTLGADAINRVVEVTGRDGKPQPSTWTIVLKEGEGTQEVDVVNGRIEAQRQSARPPVAAPVKLQDLNLDSSGAFDATDGQARKTGVRFDSINYSLRTNEKTGLPLWQLALLNQQGEPAGTIRIAAKTGTIASMEGRIAADAAAPPKKTVAESKPPAKPPTALLRTEARPNATPKTVSTVTVTERPAPPREVVRTPPVTTTTTTVQTNTPVAVIDVPDADAGAAEPPPSGPGGGFFTRTGRTLDRTSHTVGQSLDRAGHDVDHHLRRAGATVQRFFTGRSDLDGEARPVESSDGRPD